jgi:hypothetical protein
LGLRRVPADGGEDLVLYDGVLAPRAQERAAMVPPAPAANQSATPGARPGRRGGDHPALWTVHVHALVLDGVFVLGQDRLQLTPDGKAVLELRRRWTNGTTHLVFEPVELLERLAALTPRPSVNLILYHGVLAPRAAWRKAIVPPGAPEPEGGSSTRLGSSREGAASGRGPSESQLGGADAARLRV